jgi:hypothetical protein
MRLVRAVVAANGRMYGIAQVEGRALSPVGPGFSKFSASAHRVVAVQMLCALEDQRAGEVSSQTPLVVQIFELE